MWNKHSFLVIMFFVSAGLLNAQSIQQFTSSYKPVSDVGVRQLGFRFESLGFFQNNEYLGSLVAGYTLTGALVRPKFTYSPVAGLYLETGASILKYNGVDNITSALPWFSARYRFNDRVSVITGCLDATNQHGLPEQLWEPERLIVDDPEAGLQFLYSGEKLNAQTWVNWEQFIQKNDTVQEHFTMGVTADYCACQNSALSVKIPFQLLFYHQGGELNIAPEGGVRPRVQTHANCSAGWEMALNVGQRLRIINLNGYWLGYKAVTEDSNTLPFAKGHAYLLETSAQTRNSKISLSYWNAFQFIAPKGKLLYQSASNSNTSVTEPNRSVLSAKYFWQKNITKDARVAFQVDAIMDLPTGDLSYAYGFYLLLNADFLLKKF